MVMATSPQPRRSPVWCVLSHLITVLPDSDRRRQTVMRMIKVATSKCVARRSEVHSALACTCLHYYTYYFPSYLKLWNYPSNKYGYLLISEV